MINDRPIQIDLRSTVASQKTTPEPPLPEEKAPNSADMETELAVKSKALVEKSEKQEDQAVSAATLSKAQTEEVKEKVNQAIPKVRELLQKNQRSLDFKVAEKENRVIITVIDKETDKVIRQIPPEDFLQIADAVEQGSVGLEGGIFFNSQA